MRTSHLSAGLRLSAGLGDHVGPLDKGVPATAEPMPAAETGKQGWNLLTGDLPLPAAILKQSRLEANSAWMRAFVADQGVEFAPHGKTTMAPALFDLQLRDGAWGITLSTPHQIAAARAAGHKRIFVANQIVGKAAFAAIFAALDEDPDLELCTLIDSLALVEMTTQAALDHGLSRPLPVLVERGFDGGRTGCRSDEETISVARAIHGSPALRLIGVEGFEGIIRGIDEEESLAAIDAFLDNVVRCAEMCAAESLFEVERPMLSAGGSGYFDRVVRAFRAARMSARPRIMLRAGCYLSFDSGLYTYFDAKMRERIPEAYAHGGPGAALEVWAHVQSLPEPGRGIATLGKRDIGHDPMPVPLQYYRPDAGMTAPADLGRGYSVVALNDQHAYLDIPPDSLLRVGDLVGFGVSHPCLTFDKWRVIHVIDDRYSVVGSIRTYF